MSEESLEAKLMRLKREAGDISIAADAALPVARAVDDYMSSGVQRAFDVDRSLGSSTLSVYQYVNRQFDDVSSNVSRSAEQMRSATEFVASMGTMTVNTAISSGSSDAIGYQNLNVLLDYRPSELDEWVETIARWDPELAARARGAFVSMAQGPPDNGAMQARETLMGLERSFRTTGKERDERWGKAVDRYIPITSRWRPVLEGRVREAVTSYRGLVESGHARKPGVPGPQTDEQVRALVRSTVRLVRDWCVALIEAGWTLDKMASQPEV